MIRIFTLVFSIAFCSYGFACAVPIHGPEFDALISVEQRDAPNLYYLEVPKKLDGTGAARIYLSYSKQARRDLRGAEFTKELKFWFGWKVISGDFIAPKKEGYAPYIHVVWPGELCDTVANSKNLYDGE